MNIEKRIKRRKWILIGFGVYNYATLCLIFFGPLSRDLPIETKAVDFGSLWFNAPIWFCFGIVFSAMRRLTDQFKSKQEREEERKWMLLDLNYLYRISTSKYWFIVFFGLAGIIMWVISIQRFFFFGIGRTPVIDPPYFQISMVLTGTIFGMLFFDRKWLFQKNCNTRHN